MDLTLVLVGRTAAAVPKHTEEQQAEYDSNKDVNRDLQLLILVQDDGSPIRGGGSSIGGHEALHQCLSAVTSAFFLQGEREKVCGRKLPKSSEHRENRTVTHPKPKGKNHVCHGSKGVLRVVRTVASQFFEGLLSWEDRHRIAWIAGLARWIPPERHHHIAWAACASEARPEGATLHLVARPAGFPQLCLARARRVMFSFMKKEEKKEEKTAGGCNACRVLCTRTGPSPLCTQLH
jgi:hypothetical protein